MSTIVSAGFELLQQAKQWDTSHKRIQPDSFYYSHNEKDILIIEPEMQLNVLDIHKQPCSVWRIVDNAFVQRNLGPINSVMISTNSLNQQHITRAILLWAHNWLQNIYSPDFHKAHHAVITMFKPPPFIQMKKEELPIPEPKPASLFD